MTRAHDARLTAARPDLAAASLRGQVDAERYVEGARFVVRAEIADVKRQPRPDASLETQMLHGETLTVYEDENGWGWAQADSDSYVGYVPMRTLEAVERDATHRVVVNRTFVYPVADTAHPPVMAVPLDGRVAVEGEQDGFAKIRHLGFVPTRHLAPIERVVPDFVAVAEGFLGVPYLWGGKSPLGIDCSGLVQVACSIAGCPMPRDTDMQERMGRPLPIDDHVEDVARGDLVFWPGHVGILCEKTVLLHANAHHMMVVREPLQTVRERIMRESRAPISSIRRLTVTAPV